MPGLVNSSDDGTLSDLSSLATTSADGQDIRKGYEPKLSKAFASKKVGKPLKKSRASSYSLPAISEGSTLKPSGSKMLQTFLEEYGPFQDYPVTGQSISRRRPIGWHI